MPTLTADSPLHDLLEEFPFLVEFLGEFNPKFAMLKNPEMLATAGRFATLGMVAGMGGVALDELIGAVEQEIRRQAMDGEDEGAAVQAADITESEDTGPGGSGPEDSGSEDTGSEDAGSDDTGPKDAGSDASSGTGSRAEKAAELKSIIEDLHGGLSPDVAKSRFDEVVRDVSVQEIGAMEEQLIREGTPVEEIQRLCDLHVSIVKSSLEKQKEVEAPPGHPAHTYRAANEAITEVANRLGDLCASAEGGAPADAAWTAEFEEVLEKLAGVHNHYLRKENELFPVLERHGITGPSQVMWGVHDEIRAQVKSTRAAAGTTVSAAVGAGAALGRAVIEMVYKENKILLPLALETLSDAEWAEVRKGEDELGYAFVQPAGPFPGPSVADPATSGVEAQAEPPHSAPAPRPHPGSGAGLSLPIISAAPTAPLPGKDEGYLELGTGRLSLEQVDMMLRHLPLDLSFVDADGFVRYYSETEERLFPRTPGAIGRHVTNCHPPKSVHMVEEILRAFAAGDREVAEFWIEMQGKFIHIRYFAVRNPAREYLGCLEVSQDVTEIRALEGQRRLLDWS